MRSSLLLIAITLAGCASQTPPLESLPIRSAAQCGGDAIGHLGAVDVAIAIDVSSTTRFPSDADIDGDGEIGRFAWSVMTDPGDSILMAQVAAVRSLVRAAAPRRARFSIVAYSGKTGEQTGWRTETVLPTQAITRSRLTSDPAELEDGLRRVLARGSGGSSDFAAGMRRALETLTGAPAQRPETPHFLLFLSNSPHPILPQPYPSVQFPEKDHRIKIAAIRAIEAQVQIHTFALGEAVAADRPNTLTRIAGATGGVYHAVEDAGRLYCHLLAALVPREVPPAGVRGRLRP